MKKNTFINFIVFMFVSISTLFAQVGIGTTSPKGILDVTSPSYGIVYPSVALTSTQVAAPVINPATGDHTLVDGTTIYNTNTTNTGTNDVEPGIYSWDATNSEWVTHFFIRQVELYEQSSTLRTEANAGFQNVPGLGQLDFQSFTAQYSGLYRIELKVNHGGGRVRDNDNVNVVMTEGDFRFNWNGANNDFKVKAISSFNQDIGSGTNYENIWAETFKVIYVNLVAQQTYNFYLQFDAYEDAQLIGNGSTAVESTTVDSTSELINEDFEGSPTITQTNTLSGSCFTNGWRSISTGNRCADCAGIVMYLSSLNSTCRQNATARFAFTPTTTNIDINFDYRFYEVSGRGDSFRVYLHNGVSQVGPNLININNSGTVDTNTSYSGSATVIPGTTYTLRFEYINTVNGAGIGVVDHLILSETVTTTTPPSTVTEGRGYVGGNVPCYIEISYIDEN
ncbi:hypothetical protein ACFQO1_02650 [Jejudonia soesokkakensis]|uniref:Uncharacterized protein n=1 Tax=Jejudonia soesokkakensis TaxID=1323432 RepID=A0ABW2MRN6_9FLAO